MKDFSAFLDLGKYKNWAHINKIGSWKYLSEDLSCQFPIPPSYWWRVGSWKILRHTHPASRHWVGFGWKTSSNTCPAERYWGGGWLKDTRVCLAVGDWLVGAERLLKRPIWRFYKGHQKASLLTKTSARVMYIKNLYLQVLTYLGKWY